MKKVGSDEGGEERKQNLLMNEWGVESKGPFGVS